MKIKSGFLLRKIGEDTYAVSVSPDPSFAGKMIKLNETAEFLWRRLESETTEAALADALAAEYEAPIEQARADVAAFCEGLKGAGLLV